MRREFNPAYLFGAVVLAIVITIGWVGVSEYRNRGPITGTVIQKDHDSAHMSCSGKPVHCTYYSEKWKIKVQSASNPERRKWVSVPEAEWSRTTVGQAFSNGTDR